MVLDMRVANRRAMLGTTRPFMAGVIIADWYCPPSTATQLLLLLVVNGVGALDLQCRVRIGSIPKMYKDNIYEHQ